MGGEVGHYTVRYYSMHVKRVAQQEVLGRLCLQAPELMILAGNPHTFLDDMQGPGGVLRFGDNKILLKMSIWKV